MPREVEAVPLDGFAMRLRPSETESVAAAMSQADASVFADALRRMPTNDRAPVWELVIRHYARRKPLEQAAAEIGMDVIHARELLEEFSASLSG